MSDDFPYQEDVAAGEATQPVLVNPAAVVAEETVAAPAIVAPPAAAEGADATVSVPATTEAVVEGAADVTAAPPAAAAVPPAAAPPVKRPFTTSSFKIRLRAPAGTTPPPAPASASTSSYADKGDLMDLVKTLDAPISKEEAERRLREDAAKDGNASDDDDAGDDNNGNRGSAKLRASSSRDSSVGGDAREGGGRRRARSDSRSRSNSVDSFDQWRRENKKGVYGGGGGAAKRTRSEDDGHSASGRGGGKASGVSHKRSSFKAAQLDGELLGARGSNDNSTTTSNVVSPTASVSANASVTVRNKSTATQVLVDRGFAYGSQSEYLPSGPLPSIVVSPHAELSALERCRQLLSLIPDDDQLCCLHISQCPLPILTNADGSVAPATFSQSHGAFPRIDVIKKFFAAQSFAVYVHSSVRQPNGGIYSLIEFESRDEAIRCFLAIGLFIRINTTCFRVGWGRHYSTKAASVVTPKEVKINAGLYAAYVATVEASAAVAAEEAAAALAAAAESGADASTVTGILSQEERDDKVLLRSSMASWVEFQNAERLRLMPPPPPKAPTPPPSAPPVQQYSTVPTAVAAQQFVADDSASGSTSAPPPSSYLPASFKASSSNPATPTAPQQQHVAGPLALARVHSRAHQSKERPMVILREFGAPRTLLEPSDHIRYNRTVLQLTTAVDPLMNYEVLNGQGVYCDTPMFALPFEDERAVYDAVSQFGDINGITFTPDRRSVFVTFAKPQSVSIAVARARQANWIDGGVRASALGHSTQGK